MKIPNAEDKPLLTAAEVGEALGWCRSAVHDAVLRGELPELRIGRRRYIPTGPLRRLLGVDLDPVNETTPRLAGLGVVAPVVDRRLGHEGGFDDAG